MADKNKKKKSKKDSKKRNEIDKKQSLVKEMKIAYRNIDDRKKFYRTIFAPLIGMGILVFLLPFILQIIIPIPLNLNPLTFIIGGIVPIFLGFFYPYVSWKNKEADINGKMHLFITHIRVLAISDLSLKDIINVLGGKTVYGGLGEELKKISVLTTQWRLPLAKTFRFISARTPSKILKDFLDRFSQSLDSGVEHREFIETEQAAVLQEYKTMYETSNENINILNEVYVSLLIAIIFVMSLGIVLPIVIGAQDMNTFLYLSSFMLIISEGMLLYLLNAMLPPDEIWHLTGEKGEFQVKIENMFKLTLILSVALAVFLLYVKSASLVPFIDMIPFEILVAIAISPLIIPGLKAIAEEENISRKERNFLGFLPALGSISTMRGGKINDSVYYLSEKDYGVLTPHIRDLYRRLRTRINDDDAWEWFGIDSGSNFIQRSGEMFREATYAAANPRKVATMIAENVRKIRDLRVKKMAIIKTSMALFAGITFGISFSIYVSLVIARHLNTIMMSTGDPFSDVGEINIGTLLYTVPPDVFSNNFIIIFIVMTIHCFLMAITIQSMRGSHRIVTFAYFVPFVWIVAITAAAVDIGLGGYLGV